MFLLDRPRLMMMIPRGVLLGILSGMCLPVIQIQTLFRTKKCHSPYTFWDLASKIHSRFHTLPKFPRKPYPILAQRRQAKSILVFRLKRRENPTLCGGTYQYGLHRGIPPRVMIKQLNEKYFQRYAMIEQWNLDITKGPKDRQNLFAIPTARFRYI